MEGPKDEVNREQRLEEAAARLKSDEREGSSREVLDRLSYYQHAKNHPQKDETLVAEEIHEQLQRLGAFLTMGTAEQDRQDLEDVANKAGLDSEKIGQMLTVYTQRNYPEGVPEDSGFALFIDPRSNFAMPIVVPQKPK